MGFVDLDAAKDAVDKMGDNVKDIALTGYRLTTLVVVLGVFSFFAPVIFKGAVSSLKHVPSAIGEVARLPVRAYGWTRQIKEDYRTDKENKEKK
tara:strand:- start:740 stop:1021 length:282 start_codon:yes stop_codon:yes gene_type:complete